MAYPSSVVALGSPSPPSLHPTRLGAAGAGVSPWASNSPECCCCPLPLLRALKPRSVQISPCPNKAQCTYEHSCYRESSSTGSRLSWAPPERGSFRILCQGRPESVTIPQCSQFSLTSGMLTAVSRERGGGSRAVFIQEFGQIHSGGRQGADADPARIPAPPRGCSSAAALSSWKTQSFPSHPILSDAVSRAEGRAGRAGTGLCSSAAPGLAAVPHGHPCSALATSGAFPGARTLQAPPPFPSQQDFCSKRPGFPVPSWGRGGTPGLGASQAKLCPQRGGGGGGGRAPSPQSLPGSMSCSGPTPSSSPDGNEGAGSGVPSQQGGISSLEQMKRL